MIQIVIRAVETVNLIISGNTQLSRHDCVSHYNTVLLTAVTVH